MLNFEEFTFFFLVSGYRSVITGQKLFTLMIVRGTKFIEDTWRVFVVFPAILYSEISSSNTTRRGVPQSSLDWSWALCGMEAVMDFSWL